MPRVPRISLASQYGMAKAPEARVASAPQQDPDRRAQSHHRCAARGCRDRCRTNKWQCRPQPSGGSNSTALLCESPSKQSYASESVGVHLTTAQ